MWSARVGACIARFAATSVVLCATLAGAAQAAGTLTVCTDAAPEGFDIQQYELQVTNDAAGVTVFDTLVRFKRGSTELEPALAERWQVGADGLVYTLHLRKGVKFHTTPGFKPSRDFNADDVLWSINRMADKKHPAHHSARNGFVYWSGMEMSTLLAGVSKVDDHTVRFKLTKPSAPFLANLAIAPIGAMYSAEYGEQLARAGRLDALNSEPVGSGPFVFKSYQKDATVRYTANKVYWGGAPKVDALILSITIDPDVRAQRVRAGECLVALGIRGANLDALSKVSGINVVTYSPLAVSYLAPNHRKLGDARLRQALWYAVDKASYIKAVNAGLATPAASFLPSSIWGFDASLADRRDDAKARELVKASGYDGRELQLFVTKGSDRLRAAELLMSDWARVGVRSKVAVYELGELYKRAAAGEHDIVLLSWFGDNGDPDNFLAPNLSCAADQSGGNKAHWCDKEFDGWLDAAARSTSKAERVALYKRAQKRVYDQAAVIPLTYNQLFTVLHKRVRGYVPSPFAINDFRAVSLDP
ncbi:MAG: ABC transporter substrate-binding protein [Burkholderiales bacterium]|nr:ABC transporter substrate-binding protein [Burkholderiales bacterium]